MSHAERVACDVTDPEGNNFQVREKVFNVFRQPNRTKKILLGSAQVKCLSILCFCVYACVAGDGRRSDIDEDPKFCLEDRETEQGR